MRKIPLSHHSINFLISRGSERYLTLNNQKNEVGITAIKPTTTIFLAITTMNMKSD